ncbi:hypothetical protein BDV95DRAFT_202698 [Massariosphaeria phaeospora]|uniref:Uncharacterized protein n=1 Tax=Massariosphaeria phaeospora TaxID=100035 RepID=A0A7C8I6P8_9PLEO|nr:hypothetical protein BDV95DRAFT_202698 [Massariosphaeria phaeospora]
MPPAHAIHGSLHSTVPAVCICVCVCPPPSLPTASCDSTDSRRQPRIVASPHPTLCQPARDDAVGVAPLVPACTLLIMRLSATHLQPVRVRSQPPQSSTADGRRCAAAAGIRTQPTRARPVAGASPASFSSTWIAWVAKLKSALGEGSRSTSLPLLAPILRVLSSACFSFPSHRARQSVNHILPDSTVQLKPSGSPKALAPAPTTHTHPCAFPLSQEFLWARAAFLSVPLTHIYQQRPQLGIAPNITVQSCGRGLLRPRRLRFGTTLLQ